MLFKSPALRLALLALVALLLLVPLGSVQDLVRERQQRAYEVEGSIAAQWGGAQTLAGAYLQGQVAQTVEENGRPVVMHRDFVLLPDRLEIEGVLAPEVRHRGIYALPVHQTKLVVTARFDPEDVRAMRKQCDPALPLQLRMALSDSRGVHELGAVAVGKNADASLRFAAMRRGLGDLVTLGADLPADAASSNEALDVRYEIELAGARGLSWLPLGRTTRVHLKSDWRNPSFDGAFLPTRREVGPDGFDATWQVLEFNRAFPQGFLFDAVQPSEIAASAFGLSLFQPAGLYQQNDRSGKYGLLMIALVFCALFLFEALLGLALHPIQYGLVGLALALFYLLLLALSEHVGFGRAYGIAATAAVLVVSGYARAVLASTRRAAILGALQATAYGVFFLLVKSEDYALVLGAATLFAALALVMFLTRRTDWSALGKTPATST